MRKPILVLFAAMFIIIVAFSPCLAQVATGQYAFGTFDDKGLDTINIGNLNVHLTIPILNKSGRGMPFLYTLSYDSSVWYPTSVSGQEVWSPVQSFGWKADTNVVTGYVSYNTSNGTHEAFDPDTQKYVICNETTFYTFVYHDPFGIQHGFSNQTRDYYNNPPACDSPASTPSFTATANDGSGYTLSISNFTYSTLTSSSGKTIDPPGGGTGTITDPNGNQITLSSNGEFIDTTGNVALSVSGTAPNPTTLTYTDTNGNPQIVTINYASHTVQTAFGCSGISEYGPTATSLVDSIVFPDGSSYQFTYEVTPGHSPGDNVVTGRLASIRLPQGGSISYGYLGGQNGIECADGSVAGLTRSITAVGGSAASASTYLRSIPNAGTSHTKVTDGLSNDSEYDFVESANPTGTTAEYYETNRNIYQGLGPGTPILTQQTCYNAESQPCTSMQFYLPISQVDTYESLDGSQDRSASVKYNGYGLKTEEDYYDFGDASQRSLLIKEEWTYPSYGIVNLLQSDIVEDGGGSSIKDTVYGYDGTTPQQSSGVPQHVAVSGERGNLTSVTKSVGNSEAYTTTYTYEDTGSVLTMVSPTTASGATTTYTYDPTFVYNTGVQLPTPSSNVALSSSQTYDQASTGLPKVSTDANGQQTKVISYDSMLRPTEIDYPDGGKITASYSPTQIGMYRAIDGSTSTNTQTFYDGYGRVIRTAVFNGSIWYLTDSCYNAAGRLQSQSVPYSSATDTGAEVCSGNVTSYTYDALGRVTNIANADGNTQYQYYQRAVKTTDVNGVQKITQTDALGRTTGICEISGTTLQGDAPQNCGLDIAGTGFLTTYAYDLANHKTTITQGVQTRVFQTDSLGRPISIQEPESGQTTYSYAYNSTGLQITRTRPRANQTNPATTTTTTTQYDDLGRPLSITYNDGTPSKSYGYDISENWPGFTQSNMIGKLSEGSDFTGGNWAAELFTYDSMGRVGGLNECTPSTCGNHSYDKQLPYTYDLAGNQISTGDGAGVTTNYAYSVAAQVTGISSSMSGATYPSTLVSSLSEGPYGPISYQLGNGLDANYLYDSLGRVSGGWVCNNTFQPNCTGGAGQIYGFTASYTGPRVTATNDTAVNQHRDYSYDEFNRLSYTNIWNGQQTFGYVYDRYGNRWQQNALQGGPAPSYTFNKTNNQITNSGFAYDAAGNMTSDGFHTYTYDAEGNITQVDGGATAVYSYDAFNQRVRVVQGSTAVEYVYNDASQRVSTWDGNSHAQLQGQYYWGGKPVAFYQGGSLHFQHQDWEGTERVRTSYNGGVEGSYSSLPWGDGYSASGTDADAYHFAQLDHDAESDTEHAQFRQLSSTQGRWMSPDPYNGSYDMGDPQSFNRYAYVLNNPLAYVDQDGLKLVQVGPCIFDVTGRGVSVTVNNQPSDTYIDSFNYFLVGCFDNQGGNFTPAYPPVPGGGAGGGGALPPAPRYVPTISPPAPNNGTPWYKNPCIQSALAKGAASTALDGIGLLPEGGAVSEAFSLFHGAAGVSNGTKILERAQFGAALISTANAGSDVSGSGGAFSLGGAQTLTGAAVIGAGLLKTAPIVGQVISGISVAEDLYGTYKAVAGCHP